MNLKQLEEITHHTKAIAELLDSDTTGNFALGSTFKTFERKLRDELKDVVFNEYLEKT